MTSHKKPNGTTAVQCVMDAIKKSGHTPEGFFRQAAREEDQRRKTKRFPPLIDEHNTAAFNEELRNQVRDFEQFRDRGLAECRSYEIPTHVLTLAEKINAGQSAPRTYRENHDKENYRPSFSTGGR